MKKIKDKNMGICKCGHAQTEHDDTPFEVGHGSCKNCDCYRFTWTGWMEGKIPAAIQNKKIDKKIKSIFEDISNGIECSFISFRPQGTAGREPDWREACPICNSLFFTGMHGIAMYPYGPNPPSAIEIGSEMRFFCSPECYKEAIKQLFKILSENENVCWCIECPWKGVSKSLNPWKHENSKLNKSRRLTKNEK